MQVKKTCSMEVRLRHLTVSGQSDRCSLHTGCLLQHFCHAGCTVLNSLPSSLLTGIFSLYMHGKDINKYRWIKIFIYLSEFYQHYQYQLLFPFTYWIITQYVKKGFSRKAAVFLVVLSPQRSGVRVKDSIQPSPSSCVLANPPLPARSHPHRHSCNYSTAAEGTQNPVIRPTN